MSEDVIKRLQETFRPIGARWKEVKRDTGSFLSSAEEVCSEAQFRFLQKWIKETFQINIVQQRACMRMFKEDLPPEVVDRIPASMLVKIAPANMPQPDKIYRIISPDQGGPVSKRFRDWTPEEIKINIGPHGVQDLSEQHTSLPKPIATCRATDWRIEGHELILFVRSLNKEVKLPITPELVEKLTRIIVENAA